MKSFRKRTAPAAWKPLRTEGPFDLVLLDMKMPGMTGLEVLSKILQMNPSLPVVMVTAITDARPAVQAMKMGAADYLNKPFDVDEIRLVVQRVLREKTLEQEVGRLRNELQTSYKFENIIGAGPAMQKVYNLIQRLMDTDTTVLITGETGTGKELVARALHYNSVRKEGPFIPVHCAAIPSELLESELFGHEKGAFTGALQRRIGMFEAASGGTLFLDEIGEMPHGTQSKLLARHPGTGDSPCGQPGDHQRQRASPVRDEPEPGTGSEERNVSRGFVLSDQRRADRVAFDAGTHGRTSRN